MKFSTKKIAITLITNYLCLLLTPTFSGEKKDIITYNENFNIKYNRLYATYNDQDIYIGPLYYIKSIPKNDKDIYIIDDRQNKDPDISVWDSYKMNDPKVIKAVIDILTEFEEKYPSSWERSKSSMKKEWLIHNICYYLNLEPHRTGRVDFNNSDETLYSKDIEIICEIMTKLEDKFFNKEAKTLTR